jgi:hypothetical protein
VDEIGVQPELATGMQRRHPGKPTNRSPTRDDPGYGNGTSTDFLTQPVSFSPPGSSI